MLSKQRTKTKHTVPRLNFYYGNLFLICNSIHTDRLAFMTSVSLALTLPFPSHWALPETVTHVATASVTSKVKFEKKITGKVKTDKNFEFLQQWVNSEYPTKVTNLDKRASRSLRPAKAYEWVLETIGAGWWTTCGITLPEWSFYFASYLSRYRRAS